MQEKASEEEEEEEEEEKEEEEEEEESNEHWSVRVLCNKCSFRSTMLILLFHSELQKLPQPRQPNSWQLAP